MYNKKLRKVFIKNLSKLKAYSLTQKLHLKEFIV